MTNIDPSKISSFITSIRSMADDMEAMASSTPAENQAAKARTILKDYGCL